MIRRTVLALVVATASLSAFANEEAKHAPADQAVAAPVAPKLDTSKGQQIAATICVGCHGADGNSPIPVNPNLAGQVPEYIAKQLSDFKSVDGKPAARANPIMAGMAMMVPPDDVKSVAAWFSSQTLKPAVAKDEKLVAAGQKIWRGGNIAKGIPACAGCHGAAGAGLPALFPRLAGQYAEYTETQLKSFRAGERTNDAEKVMRTIAGKMSDGEIKAVAEYAAGLR